MRKYPCFAIFSNSKGFLINTDLDSSTFFADVYSIDNEAVVTDPVCDSFTYKEEATYLISICKKLYLKNYRDAKIYEYSTAYNRTELKFMLDPGSCSQFFGPHDDDI